MGAQSPTDLRIYRIGALLRCLSPETQKQQIEEGDSQFYDIVRSTWPRIFMAIEKSRQKKYRVQGRRPPLDDYLNHLLDKAEQDLLQNPPTPPRRCCTCGSLLRGSL